MEIPGKLKCKGKAIPLQTWTELGVSRKLRLPNFKTTLHKVVSHMHQPPIPPKKYSWFSPLQRLRRTQGKSAARRIM
jgi:hypothetical protein